MIARITPISTGLSEVLAVEADERTVQVAVVAREGEAVVVRRAASVDATGDLAGDLAGALGALGAGPRPRRAVLVTARATAVVLQVPPIASLPAERVHGLVRYELEPYLHEALRDGGDLACGWSDRGEAGDRPGPLLACGLSAGARDEAREAFRRAGLQLVGVYPQLGCAAALVPADAARDALVIEHAAGRLAASRVVDGQVSRLVMQRAPGDLDELAATCRGLCEDARTLFVAGTVDPDLVADLADLDARRLGAPPIADGLEPAPTVSASLLGAARHALSLPGAARLAAVAAQAPRTPLLRRPAVQGLIVAALPILLALGADLIVRAQLGTLRGSVVQLQAEADLRQRATGARKALERERDQLEAALGPLKAAAAEHAEAEGRREWLLGLLRGVSSAASQRVVVRAIEEEPGGAVRVEGVARAEVDVQAFVRDLAAAPVLAGRSPRGATITREEGRLGSASYRFEVRFGGASAPPRPQTAATWSGD